MEILHWIELYILENTSRKVVVQLQIILCDKKHQRCFDNYSIVIVTLQSLKVLNLIDIRKAKDNLNFVTKTRHTTFAHEATIVIAEHNTGFKEQ